MQLHFLSILADSAKGFMEKAESPEDKFPSVLPDTTKEGSQMGQKDLTQKNLEYYPDVFADIVNALLYEGKAVLAGADLQPAPTETLYAGQKETLRNQFHDVSKYEMKNGRIKVQYTLENESCCNKKMILRKAGYEGAFS